MNLSLLKFLKHRTQILRERDLGALDRRIAKTSEWSFICVSTTSDTNVFFLLPVKIKARSVSDVFVFREAFVIKQSTKDFHQVWKISTVLGRLVLIQQIGVEISSVENSLCKCRDLFENRWKLSSPLMFRNRWRSINCWCWSRRFDRNTASLHLATRSIVYVSLFVACWYSAISAFRSSLSFRLLDGVPS